MAFLGLIGRWEREPLPQLSQQEKEKIIQLIIGGKGWQEYLPGNQKVRPEKQA